MCFLLSIEKKMYEVLKDNSRRVDTKPNTLLSFFFFSQLVRVRIQTFDLLIKVIMSWPVMLGKFKCYLLRKSKEWLPYVILKLPTWLPKKLDRHFDTLSILVSFYWRMKKYIHIDPHHYCHEYRNYFKKKLIIINK